MPYAIQERGFEFNDEYFELHKAVSFQKMIDDEIQARKEWIALERQCLEDVNLMQREPFAGSLLDQENDPVYQLLFDKLAEYGIALDDASKQQMAQNEYYADNKKLQLYRLNDEQLLDLLLATKCNVYCMIQFDSLDDSKRYILQFYHPELIEHNLTDEGYFPTTSGNDYFEVSNTSHPEDLLDTDVFKYIEPDYPLITVYTTEDEKSALLQSLLAQYDKHFDLIHKETQTELHYLGGNNKALRAVNEVLVNPYFKIHEVTYTDLENLHQRQKEAFFQSENERIQNLEARQYQSSFWQSVKRLFGK